MKKALFSLDTGIWIGATEQSEGYNDCNMIRSDLLKSVFQHKDSGGLHILLLLTSWIFVTFFSYTTSPLYPVCSNLCDSPIFQIIGKYWAEGLVPYKDLWDIKGPFIFFVNAIGYAITESRSGVYLIQVFFIFLTMCVVFRCYNHYFLKRQAFGFTLLTLTELIYIYEGGNMTEEYILFPLTLSFYYLLQWFDAYENQHVLTHNPYHAVLYGIVLGLCLMTRLTNALSLCPAIAVVAITLLYHKEYRNLLLNAISFFMGFTAMVLPFFAYFYYHNAFNDMWNGTFLFALKYAGNSSMNIEEIGIHYFVLSYLNCFLLMFVAILKFIKSRTFTLRICFYFLSALIPFIWFCVSNGFGHYGMIVFPLFCLSLIEMRKLNLHRLFMLAILLITVGSVSKVRFMHVMYHWQSEEVIQYQEFLKTETAIDYTSFVAYNCDPNIYLALDICPAVQNFALQDFAISRNHLMKEFVIESFREKRPTWVLLFYNEKSPVAIHQLLKDRYQLVKHNKHQHLKLYQKI